MNILVCIKQVPDTNEIKIDPVTNTLIRAGVPSIVNPFDGYALEAAARIKDNDPDTKIVVMSMGPAQAEDALRECLAIAADKAYLVTDRAFGGSDTLATSYILKSAIEYVESWEGKFDLIFCGKQATDGDTAQVGPEIAEHLGYSQITYALEVQQASAEGIQVLREADDCNQVIASDCPCVVTFTKPSFDPRFPTIKRKMAARKATINQITAGDIPGIDLTRAGLKGSPTKVKTSFVPPRKEGGVMIQAETPEEIAAKLFESLNGVHVI
ncbi:MAG TPA: electron transfer flavoprotein subunit beta [Clostridiales bacterium]|nr:electron transfer flavoprotein subunit beta [Clostridiales bacterium]